MATPGYQVAIHNSLTAPILLAGAPRSFSILNATLGAALGLGLRSFWAIPIVIGLQIIGVVLTKMDPYFFEVMRRHIKQKSYYNV